MSASVVDRASRLIAGLGLPRDAEPEPMSFDEAEWRQVLSMIRFERITGLSVEAAADDALKLDDDQITQLLDAHRDAMTWCLHVEKKLLALNEAFEANGLDYVVIKGASLAQTAYEEPCLRSFADVDLLVRTADYYRACDLLGRLGHERQRPEPRPGFEARFGKASVHKHPDDLIEVDLHRTLVLGPFGLWIDPDVLVDRPSSFELAGRSIPRLDDTGAFLSVALHAALGWAEPRLVPLRDMIQIAGCGRVDIDRLTQWAVDWRLRAVLERAQQLCEERIGRSVPTVILSHEVPARERHLMARYTGQTRERGGIAISTLRAIPGMSGKAAYIKSLLFPTKAFRVARSGSASRAHRWVIPVGWIRSRG